MKNMPPIIQEVGFDFDWDNEKVWDLDLPIEDIDIKELIWHFDIPFYWTKPNGWDLKPQTILDNPDIYSTQYERTMKADIKYPIDIMHWRGRWLILDGLHRLMRLHIKGEKKIKVRKVPHDKIPSIRK